MLQITFQAKEDFFLEEEVNILQLKDVISTLTGITRSDFYLLCNGKLVQDDHILHNCHIHVVPKTRGGKGGFGSMLRAIGAQIEKTTNREACRDLSGRRLRDINEEQRLKNWLMQQVDNEQKKVERRQKKLQRLCEEPKFEFKDEAYDEERSNLTEKVEDAVLQGLQASNSSTVGEKRKAASETVVKRKKKKLWVDEELDLSSSSDDEEKIENKTTDTLCTLNPSPNTSTSNLKETNT